ncbi:MAG: hypothetical protein CVU19_11005 [Betaproteobacteria bacterium HGW-Betaproteobacteria-13]|uniref:Uncharacterized protein n=1 Tax=Parazoarcus communis TaxID=41977 RepID=A0A2U8H4N6_9RHOO|nr:hypothetical protein CEW87_14585 [Parazoarcus communis]PKO80677.1 MAG: hypothetical protein CVU19_11005 [Betaproteobacteria bacterium HGW-Betaproteobacteria-13]
MVPASSLRKKDALDTWRRFEDQGFDGTAVSRSIDASTPFEYQANIRRLWDEELGDDARLNLDNDDQAHVLSNLHDRCRSSSKNT